MSEFTFDAGITVIPTENLYIAVVGKNLTYPDNGVLPTSFGGGIGYGNEDFSLEVDAVADFNSWPEMSARVMLGGEYVAASVVPIRLGYQYDMMAGSGQDGAHAISGGLGYIDTSFSVEASPAAQRGGAERHHGRGRRNPLPRIVRRAHSRLLTDRR